MADEGIFATTAEVMRKSGANASATSNVEAYINQFMTEAESLINAESEFNWSDKFATLNVDVKGILKRAASSLAAMDVINYELTTMSSRERETMLSVLYNTYTDCIKLLKETDKAVIFIREA